MVPLTSRWFLFTVKVVLFFRASGIIGVKYSMIPFFLKIREMDNYSMYYSDPIAKQHQIIQKFMENRQQRIENDVPVLDVDFTKYKN